MAEVARRGVELAKEEAGVTAALNNLIANQNRLRRVGLVQSKEQVELLERQPRVLQGQTGVYSGLLLKGDVYLAISSYRHGRSKGCKRRWETCWSISGS